MLESHISFQGFKCMYIDCVDFISTDSEWRMVALSLESFGRGSHDLGLDGYPASAFAAQHSLVILLSIDQTMLMGIFLYKMISSYFHF